MEDDQFLKVVELEQTVSLSAIWKVLNKVTVLLHKMKICCINNSFAEQYNSFAEQYNSFDEQYNSFDEQNNSFTAKIYSFWNKICQNCRVSESKLTIAMKQTWKV